MLKNFIYRLLYRNTGQQVMNALTDSEAYKINKYTNDSLKKKIQENTLKLKNEIEEKITDASSNGEFFAYIYYYSEDYIKQGIKLIKQNYKEKGYKVRILWNCKYCSCNRKITISWKHLNKKN